MKDLDGCVFDVAGIIERLLAKRLRKPFSISAFMHLGYHFEIQSRYQT